MIYRKDKPFWMKTNAEIEAERKALEDSERKKRENKIKEGGLPPSKQTGWGPRDPKYAYARDRFGRVQTRDLYDDDNPRRRNMYQGNTGLYDKEDY